jgi:hypothetical protein
MGVTAWCLRTWPPLLIRSISHAYILDISKNYFKSLVKLIFVQSVKNPYSNSFASLHGGTLALELILVSRLVSVWPYVHRQRVRHQGDVVVRGARRRQAMWLGEDGGELGEQGL